MLLSTMKCASAADRAQIMVHLASCARGASSSLEGLVGMAGGMQASPRAMSDGIFVCLCMYSVSGVQAGGSPEGLSTKQLMDTAMSDSGWDMESGNKDGRASTEGASGQGILDNPSRSRQTPAWASAQPHRVQNMRQVSDDVHIEAFVKVHAGLLCLQRR